MRHKKSREGWPEKGYKFWAKPIDELPEEAFEIPKLMKSMWNECVFFGKEDYEKWESFCREHNSEIVNLEREWKESCQKVRDTYDRLNQDKIKYSQFDKDLLDDQEMKDLKKERSRAWKMLKSARSKTTEEYEYKADIPENIFLRNIQKKYQGKGLTCYNTEVVSKSYQENVDKFRKGKGGRPRIRNEFPLTFTIRYTQKGWKFDELTRRKNINTPFWIDPPREKGRTTFYWKFGDEIVSFMAVIHRPIPEDGFVKSIKLARDDKINRWSITFQVEYPPVCKPHGDKIVIFTPRWSTDIRIVNRYTGQRKGNLIIGQLFTFDKEGNKEVGTAISLFGSLDRNEDKTKKSFISLVDASEDFKSRAGREVEAMKAEIKSLLPKLQDLGWHGNLSSCQIGGIKRIREFMNKSLPCHPINGILDDGVEKYYRYLNHGIGIERKIRGFRDWCYWGIANRIAREGSIVYLKKINNKDLGKTKDLNNTSNEVESLIKKYKNYAAICSLYDKIKKKCAEHGIEIIEIEQEMEVQSEQKD